MSSIFVPNFSTWNKTRKFYIKYMTCDLYNKIWHMDLWSTVTSSDSDVFLDTLPRSLSLPFYFPFSLLIYLLPAALLSWSWKSRILQLNIMATPSIPNNVAVLEDDLNTNSSGNNESNSNSQDGSSSNSGDQSNNNINSNSGSRIIHIRLRPDQLQSAPENFSMVVDGVYRSSFPRPENFPFLEKMKLKSIL